MVLAEFCHTFVISLFSSEIVLKTSKISVANLDEFRVAITSTGRYWERLRDVLA